MLYLQKPSARENHLILQGADTQILITGDPYVWLHRSSAEKVQPPHRRRSAPRYGGLRI